jgi:hypothetical protein
MEQVNPIVKNFPDPVLEAGFYTGNRIPVNYFITSGKGESDIAVHAGSYHLALKAWMFDRRVGSKFGGLVCEHEGNYDLRELERRLHGSLEELYRNGFAEDYYLGNPRIISESFIPRKTYGTALTAICFTSYYHPVVKA